MIGRRLFLAGVTTGLAVAKLISSAAVNAVERRFLVPSDQTVRAVFSSAGGRMDLSAGYVADPFLESFLNDMYKTPDFIGMSDEEFDRDMARRGISLRVGV